MNSVPLENCEEEDDRMAAANFQLADRAARIGDIPRLEELLPNIYASHKLIELATAAVQASTLAAFDMIRERYEAVSQFPLLKALPDLVDIAVKRHKFQMAAHLLDFGWAPRLTDPLAAQITIGNAPFEYIIKALSCETRDDPPAQNPFYSANGARFYKAAKAANRRDLMTYALTQLPINEDEKRQLFEKAVEFNDHISFLKEHGIHYTDDTQHDTPLMRALSVNRIESARTLISLGAEPYANNAIFIKAALEAPETNPFHQMARELVEARATDEALEASDALIRNMRTLAKKTKFKIVR